MTSSWIRPVIYQRALILNWRRKSDSCQEQELVLTVFMNDSLKAALTVREKDIAHMESATS